MPSPLGSITTYVASLVLLIGLWFALSPERAYACTCIPPDPPSEALAQSAVVLAGTVVSVTPHFWDDDNLTLVKFDVTTVWKGPAYQTMYLRTPGHSSACGFTFIEGVKYVVYSQDGSLVSLCSRTRTLSEATHDLAELGKGQVPIQGTSAPNPDVSAPWQLWAIVVPTATLVVGLLAGLTWFGLRRRLNRR